MNGKPAHKNGVNNFTTMTWNIKKAESFASLILEVCLYEDSLIMEFDCCVNTCNVVNRVSTLEYYQSSDSPSESYLSMFSSVFLWMLPYVFFFFAQIGTWSMWKWTTWMRTEPISSRVSSGLAQPRTRGCWRKTSFQWIHHSKERARRTWTNKWHSNEKVPPHTTYSH